MNRYGYPKDLIDVEVKVNIEAKAEVVDIVVYVYENKDKVPFIFIKSNKSVSYTHLDVYKRQHNNLLKIKYFY